MDLPDSPPNIDEFDEQDDPLSPEAQAAAEPWISAFIARNREPLNEMLREARAELDAGLGVPFNADEIMASVRRRLAKR